MKTSALLVVGLFGFWALAGCSKFEVAPSKVQELSDDFFITQLSAEQVESAPVSAKLLATRPECETHLTQIVCETTATTEQISRNYNGVKCSSNGAQYVPA